MDLIIPKTIGDASISRNSVATYYDVNGLVTTAAAGQPRVEYDVSELRNLVAYSEELDNVYWSTENSLISPGVIPTPSGISKNNKLAASSDSGRHGIFKTFPMLALKGTYTLSVYAKAAEETKLKLEFKSSSGAVVSTIFDLVAGTKTDSGSVTSHMTSVGDGWHRCDIEVNNTAYNPNSFGGGFAVVQLATPTFGLYVTRETDSFAGDTSNSWGVYVSGVQLDKGYITSYICTPVITRSNYVKMETVASANMVPYSDMPLFYSSVANFSNAKITQYAGTAPDGSIRACKLGEGIGSAPHTVTITPSFSGTSTLESTVFSVYVKAVERFKLEVITQYSSAKFNLDVGSVSNETGVAIEGCSIKNVGNDWWRISMKCMASNAASPAITLRLVLTQANGTDLTNYVGYGFQMGVLLWGFQYERGTVASSYSPSVETWVSRTGSAGFYNNLGLYTTATGARKTYNPDLLNAPPVLIAEPAATNLLAYSEAYNQTSWVKTNVSVLTTSVTTPAGTARTTSTLSPTGAVDGVLSQNFTAVIGNNYVFSVWLKADTPIEMSLSINETSAGIIGNQAILVGTTWKRYCVSTSPAPSSTGCSVKLTGGGGNWISGATPVYAWGAQLEVAPSHVNGPSAYIATVGASAVARPADVFTQVNGTRASESAPSGFLHSNVTETEYPQWSSTVTYGSGQYIIYNHKVYFSLQANNVGKNPETDLSSPPFWTLIGSTNKYAMFDTSVGTQTVVPSGSLTVYTALPANSVLSFNNMDADSFEVTLFSLDNTEIYFKAVNLTGGESGVPITDYTVTDVATSQYSVARVTFKKASGNVKVGNYVIGTRFYLGSTETSPTIGIVDYSIKSTDSFGNPTLVARPFSKRMGAKVFLDTQRVDLIARQLASVRATACVWNGNNPTGDQLSSLIVYGNYKDFEIEVAWTTKSYLDITIEGLV